MTDNGGGDPDQASASSKAAPNKLAAASRWLVTTWRWLVTTWRLVQQLDVDAWRKLRSSAPLQFLRWLAALLTVIFYLPHGSGTQHYVYVGAIVALLVFPDAQSIGFGGLRFERLRNEVAGLERQIVTIYLGESVRQEATAGDTPEGSEPAEDVLHRYRDVR